MKDLFDKIECCMSENVDDKAALLGEFNSLNLSKDKFFPIRTNISSKNVVFVDGGSTVIIDSPSLCVGFVRAVALVMCENKTKKMLSNEFFVISNAKKPENNNNDKNNKEDIIYNVDYFENDHTSFLIDPIRINSMNDEISNKNERIRLSRTVDIARRFLELQLSMEVIEELDDGDTIVIDGNLRSMFPKEDSILKKLYDKGMEKNVLITALSKTSNIITENGDTLAAAISKIAPNGQWYYFPAFKSNDLKHDADSFFVKFNPKSEYVFCLDIYKKQSKMIDRNRLMGFLACCSKDVAFPGYPYGLVKVDQLARISNNETDILLTRFSASNPKLFEKLKPYMNTLNSHSVLDSM